MVVRPWLYISIPTPGIPDAYKLKNVLSDRCKTMAAFKAILSLYACGILGSGISMYNRGLTIG